MSLVGLDVGGGGAVDEPVGLELHAAKKQSAAGTARSLRAGMDGLMKKEKRPVRVHEPGRAQEQETLDILDVGCRKARTTLPEGPAAGLSPPR